MDAQTHILSTSPWRQHQVFVNFRGDELRYGFVSHLVEALLRHQINVFIDKLKRIGEDLNNLFVRIEKSTIALVIFSKRYTESIWCLDELVKIKQRIDQGFLKVIPVFFNVKPVIVKQLKGGFGDQFRDRAWEYRCDETRVEKWKEALASVSCKIGLTFEKKSEESQFVKIIVKEVEKMLEIRGNTEVFSPLLGRNASSVRGQCINIVSSTQNRMVLARESAQMHESSKIANKVNEVTKVYMDMESENDILRAQTMELSERLQSLNSIIEMFEETSVETIPGFLMNPWQITNSPQLIMASADTFNF